MVEQVKSGVLKDSFFQRAEEPSEKGNAAALSRDDLKALRAIYEGLLRFSSQTQNPNMMQAKADVGELSRMASSLRSDQSEAPVEEIKNHTLVGK